MKQFRFKNIEIIPILKDKATLAQHCWRIEDCNGNHLPVSSLRTLVRTYKIQQVDRNGWHNYYLGKDIEMVIRKYARKFKHNKLINNNQPDTVPDDSDRSFTNNDLFDTVPNDRHINLFFNLSGPQYRHVTSQMCAKN